MNTFNAPEIEIAEAIDDLSKMTKLWSLIVFNDDVNTFDHVIATLIDVCKHSMHQAEQCAMIIHFKGKCAVNSGEFDELALQRDQICSRGISAEVILK